MDIDTLKNNDKRAKLSTPENDVAPAKAGVRNSLKRLDSCFRRNDGMNG
jgi:hypothetical protein